ncbi:MAG: bifunctional 5,10-methylene-tetrahydrofolate dehydrogenase/5,10-methylene-tetrahydrofolate cyclohydrolase, partial [Lachnospiraceae bacterium]|nr:bifunctional 5,10-methylene-tetrahydrofolate dehydrogenase/5,10-methylene-tetrahydrofolate cyclohydrolase [Lachnospiraceae bacterium]
MARQLLGKEVTEALNARISERAQALRDKGVVPKLATVRCGENPSDISYEKGALKRAADLGVETMQVLLPEDISKEDLIAKLQELNADDSVHGVLLFRPLPKHLKDD